MPGRFCQYVFWSATTRSMCTGGGSVLAERLWGSTTLMPSPTRNHSLPSRDFATLGPNELGATTPSLTPSLASHSVVSMFRFESAIQASSWLRVMRTSPQSVYNHTERSLSSIDQWMLSHGKPFLDARVAM